MSYGRRITRPAATALDAGRTCLTNKHAIGLGMLVSTLLVCGCGGSTGAGPTQAEFVTRANAFCTVALRSAASVKTPKSAAELLSFSEQASAIVSKLVSELKAVTPPSNSRVAYSRFLTTSAHEARMLGELEQALRVGSTARAHAALQALNSGNAVNEEAMALGLTECARTVTQGS